MLLAGKFALFVKLYQACSALGFYSSHNARMLDGSVGVASFCKISNEEFSLIMKLLQ